MIEKHIHSSARYVTLLFLIGLFALPSLASAYGQGSYYAQASYYTQSYYQASYTNISTFITGVPFATGAGGYAPATYIYWGGGGGGGLVINESTVRGGDGYGSAGNGGEGYGAGGGGSYLGAYGGNGAPGMVYVEWDDRAPATPTISGPTGLVVSVSGTYTFTATDPESDTIRYGIDWNSDGSVDEWAPTLGYVASGVSSSATHSWSSTGTKTFKVLAEDSAGEQSGWASQSVTVSNAPPIVLLTASPSSITGSQSSTLTWSSSGATSCAGTNFSTSGATSGTVSVSPTVTTTYTATCTGAGGSGNSSKTVTYSCSPTNICSSGNVVNSCTGAVVQTCSYQCGAGACISPPPPTTGEFEGTNGGSAFTASGHLQAKPQLVRSGTVTYVYWNVSNVSSCTVTGSNGNSWTGSFSGASGKTSLPITQRTTFTLTCTGLDSSTLTESQVVNVIPVFQEQ